MSRNLTPDSAQLTTLLTDRPKGHEANFSLHYVAAARTAYAALYALWQQVNLVEHEGLLEVTLRTRTGSVVVPLDADIATEVVAQLQEMLGGNLEVLQTRILSQLQEAEREQDDLTSSSTRAQALALCLPAAESVRVVPMSTDRETVKEQAA